MSTFASILKLANHSAVQAKAKSAKLAELEASKPSSEGNGPPARPAEARSAAAVSGQKSEAQTGSAARDFRAGGIPDAGRGQPAKAPASLNDSKNIAPSDSADAASASLADPAVHPSSHVPEQTPAATRPDSMEAVPAMEAAHETPAEHEPRSPSLLPASQHSHSSQGPEINDENERAHSLPSQKQSAAEAIPQAAQVSAEAAPSPSSSSDQAPSLGSDPAGEAAGAQPPTPAVGLPAPAEAHADAPEASAQQGGQPGDIAAERSTRAAAEDQPPAAAVPAAAQLSHGGERGKAATAAAADLPTDPRLGSAPSSAAASASAALEDEAHGKIAPAAALPLVDVAPAAAEEVAVDGAGQRGETATAAALPLGSAAPAALGAAAVGAGQHGEVSQAAAAQPSASSAPAVATEAAGREGHLGGDGTSQGAQGVVEGGVVGRAALAADEGDATEADGASARADEQRGEAASAQPSTPVAARAPPIAPASAVFDLTEDDDAGAEEADVMVLNRTPPKPAPSRQLPASLTAAAAAPAAKKQRLGGRANGGANLRLPALSASPGAQRLPAVYQPGMVTAAGGVASPPRHSPPKPAIYQPAGPLANGHAHPQSAFTQVPWPSPQPGFPMRHPLQVPNGAQAPPPGAHRHLPPSLTTAGAAPPGAQPYQYNPLQGPSAAALATSKALLAAAKRGAPGLAAYPGQAHPQAANGFGQPDLMLQRAQRPYSALDAADQSALPLAQRLRLGAPGAGPSTSAAGAGPSTSAAKPEPDQPAFQAVVDALTVCSNEPAYPPEGSMTVTIMPHQALALGWMKSREGGQVMPDGGILADDQGLGKTITTIALLVSNKVEPARAWKRIETDLDKPAPSKRAKLEAAGGRGAAAAAADAGYSAVKREDGEVRPELGRCPAAAAAVAAAQARGAVKEEPGAACPGGGMGPSGAANVISLTDSDDEAPGGAVAAAKREELPGGAVAAVKREDPPRGPVDPRLARGAGARPAVPRVWDDGLPRAGTLIVAPTSLLSQWEQEIRAKVDASQRINVLLYHGKGKESVTSGQRLAAYSVVITSYTLLANECRSIVTKIAKGDGANPIDLASDDDDDLGDDADGSKARKRRKRNSNDGLLFNVHWHRIVLDEGQMIKNHRTKQAQACWQLSATHRWILSGTPIQNSVTDLYSYFRFLQWRPFDVMQQFKQHIHDPIKQNPEKGFRKLQGVLAGVLLRRTKASTLDGKPILDIPPCTQTLSSIDFLGDERTFYTRLEVEGKKVIAELRAGDNKQEAYFHALAHLMRLRQACCHPQLVKQSVTRKGGEAVGPEALKAAAAVPEEARLALLRRLARADQCSCVHCDDIADDPVAAVCEHLFCRTCALAFFDGADGVLRCPACGVVLKPSDVHSGAALIQTARVPVPPELRKALEAADAPGGGAEEPRGGGGFKASTKIARLMEVLDVVHARSPPADPAAAAAAAAGDGAAGAPRPPPRARASSSFFKAALHGGGKRAGGGASAGGGGRDAARSGRPAPEKAIVFSQWTGFLDLVEPALAQRGYKFRRVDGRMSLPQRESQLSDFKTDPTVTVLLLSLRAASLGLNLVVANHVVLLDLWWNPTVEDQAIDRTHRIGQTRPVSVTRITIKDTVEDRIIQLQQKKRAVVNATFSETKGGTGAQLTREDLLFLFS